jgi:hypothetical protein
MRARPYQSLLAGIGVSLAAGCASVPITPTPADIRGKNAAPSLLANLRPDFLYYHTMWNSYLERRGPDSELDKKIEACRKNPDDCPPLFQAWVKMIDTVNMVPDESKLTKAELIVSFVANLLQFDKEKATVFNALFHTKPWLQSPTQTLVERNGNGVCGDFSVMIYETTKRTKSAIDDISLIGGIIPPASFHTVATVTIDKTKYVMDAVGYSAGNFQIPILAKYDDYIHGVHFKNSPRRHTSRFIPLFEMNDRSFNFMNSITDVFVSTLENEKPREITPVQDRMQPSSTIMAKIMPEIQEIDLFLKKSRGAELESETRIPSQVKAIKKPSIIH